MSPQLRNVPAADTEGTKLPDSSKQLSVDAGQHRSPLAAGEAMLNGALNGTFQGLVKGAVAPAPCGMPPGERIIRQKAKSTQLRSGSQEPRWRSCLRRMHASNRIALRRTRCINHPLHGQCAAAHSVPQVRPSCWLCDA